MEKILSLRGMLFGALGGLIAYVFMKLLAEPIIGRAIEYESGRDETKMDLARAAGAPMDDMGGPDLFSRGIQSTIGAGVGMIAFGIAMGGLAAVVLALWLHRRGTARAERLVWPLVAMIFAASYLLPTLKYPANPPSIGNPDTIKERTGLFVAMILISAVSIVVAAVIRQRLRARLGEYATWVAIGVVVVVFIIAATALPDLGSLAVNSSLASATETPGPLTGPDGTIVYPGFPADDLYSFRLYSGLAQVILWFVIGLGLRGAIRSLAPAPASAAPAATASGSATSGPRATTTGA